ncbi:hypothetical protein GQ44DRAFT_807327 [Phaeosphaeriaceae sp. PMI808]|nr:hypothetical protein GQ44DRAFT_807327 [Phaeosphaeriaceae sp. PMI808]
MKATTFSLPLLFTSLVVASPQRVIPKWPGSGPKDNERICGTCYNYNAMQQPLFAGGCNALEDGYRYLQCSITKFCGICMFFKGDDCMGELVLSDGPTNGVCSSSVGEE